MQSPSIILSLNALMSLSLIVAELVTNSLKHAFRNREDGTISVTISGAAGVHTLRVADDGPGLPADFGKGHKDSLGQGILQSLARQLGGSLVFERGPGAVARLDFHS